MHTRVRERRRYLLGIGELIVPAAGLWATQMEYAVLFFQFVCSFTLATVEIENTKIGMGRAVKMTSIWAIQQAMVDRVEVLSKTFAWSMLDLLMWRRSTDESSGALNAIVLFSMTTYGVRRPFCPICALSNKACWSLWMLATSTLVILFPRPPLLERSLANWKNSSSYYTKVGYNPTSMNIEISNFK